MSGLAHRMSQLIGLSPSGSVGSSFEPSLCHIPVSTSLGDL
jgi:hypothetical protein